MTRPIRERAMTEPSLTSHDRITQLRISGLRTIADLTLDLRGLTVLIGDNGTGKSSILEALELLRLAAKPVSFIPDIVAKAHGGLGALLRRGADELRLGVTIEGTGPRLDYEFSVGNVGSSPKVLNERVDIHVNPEAPEPLHALVRMGSDPVILDVPQPQLLAGSDLELRQLSLLLPRIGVLSPAFSRVADALSRIELHVPFETRPLWQQRQLDVRVGPRWPSVVEQPERLDRYALNLPNAFQQLRNLGGEVWRRVVVRARLGLGDDVRDFRLTPSGRGNIELEVVLGSAPDKPLPAEYLSEGQLAYLAFLALVELDAHRSVLAFDEPELHLHPALLTRVVWLLENVSEHAPVIVATHSDRLLDALHDPEHSVVLCDLDEHRALRLRRPNKEKLADWLEDYRGLGSIRADGYEAHVFDPPVYEDGEP
jgi:predicted ATPase